jgi:hypothetical protein
MTKSRDPLTLSPHWHIDCRLETELPEDNVVGKRFLVNALFGSSALTLVLFAGWLAYLVINFRGQIHDWDQRISDSKRDVGEIQRMQRDYLIEARKVDSAYALMKAPLFISDFIARLGQILPPQMVIDSIESSNNAILVRGSIHATFETAGELFNGYLKRLPTEAEIGPFFEKISPSGFVRADESTVSFEITFQKKPSV